MTNEIKLAYKAGLDYFKNGANLMNCNFRHFTTKEQSIAWRDGQRKLMT